MFSSWQLEKRLVEDIGFRVLAACNDPDFGSISGFRLIHLQALEGLFEQVVRLALKLGAMRLGRVAIDGSKQKTMGYRRIERDQKRLKEEAHRLWAEAEQSGNEEDWRYGRSRGAEDLAAELACRQSSVCATQNVPKLYRTCTS